MRKGHTMVLELTQEFESYFGDKKESLKSRLEETLASGRGLQIGAAAAEDEGAEADAETEGGEDVDRVIAGVRGMAAARAAAKTAQVPAGAGKATKALAAPVAQAAPAASSARTPAERRSGPPATLPTPPAKDAVPAAADVPKGREKETKKKDGKVLVWTRGK